MIIPGRPSRFAIPTLRAIKKGCRMAGLLQLCLARCDYPIPRIRSPFGQARPPGLPSYIRHYIPARLLFYTNHFIPDYTKINKKKIKSSCRRWYLYQICRLVVLLSVHVLILNYFALQSSTRESRQLGQVVNHPIIYC